MSKDMYKFDTSDVDQKSYAGIKYIRKILLTACKRSTNHSITQIIKNVRLNLIQTYDTMSLFIEATFQTCHDDMHPCTREVDS